MIIKKKGNTINDYDIKKKYGANIIMQNRKKEETNIVVCSQDIQSPTSNPSTEQKQASV
jgi:hypothetical protein